MRLPFTICVAFCFSGIVLLNLFYMDLWEHFWLLVAPATWVFLIASIFTAFGAAKFARCHPQRRCTDAMIALVIVFAGLVTHFGFGEYLRMDARFMISRNHYERRLAEVLAGSGAKSDDVARVEQGTSPRVAFYWQRGVIDNWVGLIHDPTGELMQAAKYWSNRDDPSLDKVRDLFGGVMYFSRHISGNWYFCWFT